MLEQLSIKNFAIIEDLSITFNKGFSAISGETGAGKSIIIAALNMLLGERSVFDKIRSDKQKAFIEGVFKVENKKLRNEIEDIIDEELEDDTLILFRSLDKSNKTSIKINNRTFSLSVLKEISSKLLDIHSSQKDLSYLKEENQLSLLDEYIIRHKNKDDLLVFDEYKSAYNELIEVEKEIELLNSSVKDYDDIDILEYQVKELEKADIQPQEMENLEEEKASLSNFSKTSERIIAFLNTYQEASSLLYKAKKELSYINDDNFSSYDEKFNEAYYELEDINDEINNKFEELSSSLNRLEYINDRLFFLHSLRKKYGYTTDDILSTFEKLKIQLDNIKNFDVEINKLNVKKNNVLFELNNKANALNKVREKYALLLNEEVNAQLKDLYLNNAEFKCNITKNSNYSNKGNDKIKFLLRANVGQEFLSLEKTASLGETSRLNLALKTVFNKLNSIPCIIFDEIDIGISGRVATSVCKKMKEISNYSQVITISHLPSVAAGAKYHYFVKKEVINDETFSSISLLNNEERIIEIAKMISGEVNDASLNAAKDLINASK